MNLGSLAQTSVMSGSFRKSQCQDWLELGDWKGVRPRQGGRASEKIKLKSEQRQHTLSREKGDSNRWFLRSLPPGGPASAH